MSQSAGGAGADPSPLSNRNSGATTNDVEAGAFAGRSEQSKVDRVNPAAYYWSPSYHWMNNGSTGPGMPAPNIKLSVKRGQGQAKTFSKSAKNVLNFDRLSSNVMERRVREAIQAFDVNHDGTLDIDELTGLVEHLLKEESNSRMLKYMFLGMTIFCLILIAATTGLTYAMVLALKDTEVTNNVMVTKDGATVQTASSDFKVDTTYGALVSRGATTNADGSTDPAVLRTSTFSGLSQPLSSVMDIKELIELNYLEISTPDGSGQLAMKVLGVARVPMPQSLFGSVVNILTVSGTIVLDGEELMFSEKMEPVFRTAGFIPDGAGNRRRRLLGATNGQTVTGRYNRKVKNVPVPVPEGYANRTAWRTMSKADKKAAKDATRLLKKLLDDRANDRAYAAMWYDYKVLYDKAYDNMTADYQAFSAWKENMLQVLDTNFDDTVNFWTTLNMFSDMPFTKLETTLLMKETVVSKRVPSAETEFETTVDVAVSVNTSTGRRTLLEKKKVKKQLPPLLQSVNWTSAGKVTPVRDQGMCGSCWTFAATGALESALLIVNGSIDAQTLDLSEQQFLNCVNVATNSAYTSRGCDGGDPFDAISYTYTFNQTAESVMQYTGLDLPCDRTRLRLTKPGQVVQLQQDADWVQPAENEEALMRAIMRQPIAIGFVADAALVAYSGGVFQATTCPEIEPNHMMLLTGYDISGPERFWIIKNSWGPNWGENGYFRVRMTGDARGPCGLYMVSAFPPLKTFAKGWIYDGVQY